MPRIETTQTLARSLGPAGSAPSRAQLGFDAAARPAAARRAAARASLGRGLVAHAIRAPSSRRSPRSSPQRTRWRAPPRPWRPSERAGTGPRAARAAERRRPGPGATERAARAHRARMGSASAAAPTTDALFALRPVRLDRACRPAAPIRSRRACWRRTDAAPCLVVDSRRRCRRSVPRRRPHGARHRVAVCADFEDEAQRAAAQVLADLRRGRAPVALIAQDRVLVRRVRALLARQRVALHDETGWKLSTTRAAAHVMGAAARRARDAGSDDVARLAEGCADWPGSAARCRARSASTSRCAAARLAPSGPRSIASDSMPTRRGCWQPPRR